MIETRLMTVADIEAWIVGVEELELQLGRYAFDGAVLPPDEFKQFLGGVLNRPVWTGVWGFIEGKIAGSGMFKGDLVEGWIEIGYGVSPEVEGRGVGTAIARHLTEYALESGASVVRAHTLSDAPASQRILEKLGYQYVGQFEEPEDGLVNRYEVIKSGEVDE